MTAAEREEGVHTGQLAADELRLAHELGNAPIVDLWQFIDEKRDVELAFHRFEGDGDGLYRWDGLRGLIVVNSATKAFGRMRFTAAHELGHHLMHREGGILELTDKNIWDNGGERREVEANAFAAHLLAPTAAMRAAFSDTPSDRISVDDVVDLMIGFGLSFRTAVYRLHNADRIAARDRDRLVGESRGLVKWMLSARGHQQEALRPTELPPSYTAAVLRLHRTQVIDDQRLAELLDLSVEAATALAAGVGQAGDPLQDELGELGDLLDESLAGRAGES